MEFPRPGQRIAIRGLSGSGKTTLGDQLSELLGIPHTEMDALFWKANWGKSTNEEFFAKIEAITSQSAWILCGNYSRTRSLIDPLAETIIWLDYPFPLTLSRLLRRSILRGRKHQLLWGHCQETVLGAFTGKDAIVWWIFRYRKRHRRQMQAMFDNPEPNKDYLRFRHPRETEAWLESLKVK